MSRIGIESLDEGDELGLDENPQCCDVAMNDSEGGFECGRCDSSIAVNAARTVTYVAIV